MITKTGHRLLERWIYVLVKVKDAYVVPFTDEALHQVASDPGYDAAFGPFLHRFLSALATSGWPAGSYYPGGWFRRLRASGDDLPSVAIVPEALGAFFQEEMVVDPDGRWFVGRKAISGKVLAYFLANLHFDAALQRYLIRYRLEGYFETRYIHHYSPPFRVVRVTAEEGGVVLWLNNGDREALRPETLRIDRNERLYCAVLPEQVPAVFEEAARWEILKDVEERKGGWVVTLSGQDIVLAADMPWPYADRIGA
ncbi:MAG: hypothetical protein IIA40_11090 [SAR324 cluster bacterium]|nr:hypothetical protein [SAR324 cluster bacterium]